MDCYSAFWNNGDCTQTSLFVDLLRRGVTDLYVCGLAFDVCVKETATDAVGQGFKTHVIVDACRGLLHLKELQKQKKNLERMESFY